MTHRDEQSMRRRTESTHIADSALEDHHVQVSRAASISAILVRSRSRAGTEMGRRRTGSWRQGEGGGLQGGCRNLVAWANVAATANMVVDQAPVCGRGITVAR